MMIYWDYPNKGKTCDINIWTIHIAEIKRVQHENGNLHNLAMKIPWYSVKWDDGSEGDYNSDSFCSSQVFEGTQNLWLQRLESWQFNTHQMLHIPKSIVVLMIRSFFVLVLVGHTLFFFPAPYFGPNRSWILTGVCNDYCMKSMPTEQIGSADWPSLYKGYHGFKYQINRRIASY